VDQPDMNHITSCPIAESDLACFGDITLGRISINSLNSINVVLSRPPPNPSAQSHPQVMTFFYTSPPTDLKFVLLNVSQTPKATSRDTHLST
jgi:hypothetical protein